MNSPSATNEPPRLLVFAASTRSGSLNERLIRIAGAEAGRLGAEVKHVDLADYPMPLYSGDLEREQGVPASAVALAREIRDHPGLMISTPEYNGAFPPLLKNTIDWVSRVERGLLADKPVGLLSASPGPGGGRRALDLTRTWLRHMRADVVIEPFSLPKAPQAYSGDNLVEPQATELSDFVAQVIAAVPVPRSVPG